MPGAVCAALPRVKVALGRVTGACLPILEKVLLEDPQRRGHCPRPFLPIF
jgi:hypothetical protein